MAALSGLLGAVQKTRAFSSARRSLTVGRVIYSKTSKAPKHVPSSSISAVPGLSENVLQVTTEPVGPGAAKTTNYKNPEYFCYNNMSYFEAEVEMLKYRLPQPSNKPNKS